MRVSTGKTRVFVGAPLHRGADTVAIAKINVIAHANLVAVIENWASWQREQQGMNQLQFPSIITEQRSQSPANSEIDPRTRISSIDPVHVVALFLGDHLESQLVVVTQEDGPLTIIGNGGGLFEDVGGGITVLHMKRHEHTRHQREM